MTGITCALVGTGGSGYAGTATVTVGFLSVGGFTSYGFDNGAQGSITPSLWANSGVAVEVLKYVTAGWIEFTVAGIVPNTGWSTLTIGSTTVNRADGSYSTSGGNTRWIFSGAPNAFGTTVGATRAITWA